jgi:hypothetical protein
MSAMLSSPSLLPSRRIFNGSVKFFPSSAQTPSDRVFCAMPATVQTGKYQDFDILDGISRRILSVDD